MKKKIELRSPHRKREMRTFPINVIDIDMLNPHEMIIESELEFVIEDLKKNKILWYPIVIDKKSKIVLDGHHRFEALKRLGFKKIPVIELDYQDEDLIQVDTWYPIIKVELTKFLEELKELGFIFSPLVKIENSLLQDLSKLKSRDITAIIHNNKLQCHVKGDREKIFQLINKKYLEGIIYTDSQELSIKHSDLNTTSVISWGYTKKEIVQLALKGRTFLPKTTRHTIKYQYQRIDFNIDELTT